MAKQNYDWTQSNIQHFWGNLPGCDHVVQIYQDEKVLIESLEGFAGSSILAGNGLVVIASDQHLTELNSRLRFQNLDIDHLIFTEQYIPLNAKDCMEQFMRNGKVEEELFVNFFSPIIRRARGKNRKVHAFGEMVADLWLSKNFEATLALEVLWNKLCSKEEISLYCAYPAVSFKAGQEEELLRLCNHHSRVIGGWPKPSTQIYYRNLS